MRAIVILYEGNELPLETQKDVIAAMAQFISMNTKPSMIQFDNSDVAKLVVTGALGETARIIKVEGKQEEMSPEEAAITYIAGVLKSKLTPTSTTYDLSSAVIKILLKGTQDEKFVKAVNILAFNNKYQKISDDMYARNHMSKDQMKIVIKTCEFCKVLS